MNPADFTKQLGQWGNIEVPFKQGWENTEMCVGRLEQFPDGIDHVCAVGIHPQVLGFDVMTGNMGVSDALRRQ